MDAQPHVLLALVLPLLLASRQEVHDAPRAAAPGAPAALHRPDRARVGVVIQHQIHLSRVTKHTVKYCGQNRQRARCTARIGLALVSYSATGPPEWRICSSCFVATQQETAYLQHVVRIARRTVQCKSVRPEQAAGALHRRTHGIMADE